MRILTNIKGNQSDFLHEAGQELIRPFSVVFGRTYNTKDKISEEHTSTIKKVITVFIAAIILPLTLLFGAIGALMVNCSSSHKKTYKQIQTEQNHIVQTSTTSPTSTRIASSTKLLQETTSQIELFIKERGLQEKIALNARWHLSPFNSPCAYPKRIGCATPFVWDSNKRHAQSRQVLFDELSIILQNSLNALEASEKNLIIDQIVGNQITEYDGIVQQMEKDIFSVLNKSDLLNLLKFDERELNFNTLNEHVKGNLRQRLTKPLSERLNQLAPSMQDNLLISAYCQLKKIKTGTGDVIEC